MDNRRFNLWEKYNMNKKSHFNLVTATTTMILILAGIFNILIAYNNYNIAKNNQAILQNNVMIFDELNKQMQIINQIRLNALTNSDINCHTDIYKYDYQNNTFYLVQSSDYLIEIKGWNEEGYRIGTEYFKFHKVCS